ncbi:MAG: exo-alpha-sialidase [Chthoniobacterales bacterium]|nr:exo-alpha-sialidase [Chthoniobacterales bacterium]
MTTRFNARLSGIFIRRSADGGQTWDADRLVRRVQVWQADPQVQVDGNGTVYAVWLSGPNWKSALIKSFDHGATWTEPVVIAPPCNGPIIPGWWFHPTARMSTSG